MAVLQEASPVLRRGIERMGNMQQAGRSETLLRAEVGGAPLRSASSVPTIRQESPDPTPPTSDGVIPGIDEIPTTAASSRRGSNTPLVPSPLYESSARTSISNPSPETVTEVGVSTESSTLATPEEPATGLSMMEDRDATQQSRRPGLYALNLPRRILKQKSAPSVGSGFVRPETPKTLKDLGRDYSRYPRSGASSITQANSNKSKAAPIVTVASTTSLNAEAKNPFSDSHVDLEQCGYPDDRIGSLDPYFGGEKGFILYTNEIEADDSLHMPRDDDDVTYKPKLSDHFDRRSIVSTVGGFFLVLGLIAVFIVFPVLTYSTHIFLGGQAGSAELDTGPAWAHVNNRTYNLLKNVRRGLIDPDTPESAKTRKSIFDDSTLQLVFSDEFNENNRTFYPGDDPYWFGADFWYGSTQDMEWYDPDAITTYGGTLQLRLDAFQNHNLNYRSGMLNSWNQMCFKGGIFEVSVSLAGPSGIPGLWPGVWTMGNLGRPGYKATTEGVWPYTYDSCDHGITPNQSSTDGLSFLPGQKLSSCTCDGADHPNPGTGRGAPEIDILEGSVDPTNRIGVVTQSFQVAPFDVFWRPNSDFLAMPDYNTTQMNGYTGGPFQQAVSATTLLNNAWYDGNAYQKYAFEYVPGTSKGKIAWFVGENPSFIMDGKAIGANGNVEARQVSEEPMSMILNLGISGSWSQILLEDLKFPTLMHVDYVRIYQHPNSISVTCDPPGYPTTKYIEEHPIAYQNPNLTMWDETGYGWPKNKLTGC